MQTLKAMINLTMPTITEEEIFKKEKNKKLRSMIRKNSMESLDEESVSAGRGRHSSENKHLLNYVESDSRSVRHAKQGRDLCVKLRWIGAKPKMYGEKSDKIYTPSWKDRCLVIVIATGNH